jgi:hypothetical protein
MYWMIQGSLPGRDKMFLFSTMFTPACGPTELPIQWVTGFSRSIHINIKKMPISFIMSAQLSVCNGMDHTGQNFTKFDTGDYCENLLRNSRIWF